MKTRIGIAAAKAVIVLAAVAKIDETDIVSTIANKAIALIGQALAFL